MFPLNFLRKLWKKIRVSKLEMSFNGGRERKRERVDGLEKEEGGEDENEA